MPAYAAAPPPLPARVCCPGETGAGVLAGTPSLPGHAQAVGTILHSSLAHWALFLLRLWLLPFSCNAVCHAGLALPCRWWT